MDEPSVIVVPAGEAEAEPAAAAEVTAAAAAAGAAAAEAAAAGAKAEVAAEGAAAIAVEAVRGVEADLAGIGAAIGAIGEDIGQLRAGLETLSAEHASFRAMMLDRLPEPAADEEHVEHVDVPAETEAESEPQRRRVRHL